MLLTYLLRSGHALTEGRIFDPTVPNLPGLTLLTYVCPPMPPNFNVDDDRYDSTTTRMVCVLLTLSVDKNKSSQH